MASASTSVWLGFPLALALMLDNSIFPCMSLMHFELLPQNCSSALVSLNKSMCGPFKQNGWDSGSPSSDPATERSYGQFSPQHWNPDVGL